MTPAARLPAHKHDLAAVEALARLPASAWIAHAPQLLEWLRDGNWPVARPVARLLASAGAATMPALARVFDGDDAIWKCGCIESLLAALPPADWEPLRPRLQRLADAPDPAELAEGAAEAAQTLLRRRDRA